jgi:protein KRI1
LRQKDDSIYDKNKKFFSEEEEGSTSHDEDARRTKTKPKTYKDLVREEILEKMEKDGDDDASSVDTEAESERKDLRSEQSQDRLKKLAYDDEQKALREEFLKDEDDNDKSAENDGSDGDWLVKKKKSDDSNDENDKERLETIDALAKTAEMNGSTLADPKGEVEDGEKFLLDFIKNKRWIDHNDNDADSDSQGQNLTERRVDEEADGNDSDSSLKELDRTDAFESKYNFRFEEANENSGAGLSVIGYSRSALSDTIRRKDETRRLKRQQRKERKEAERKAKEERLRRLKNAKKEELEERIKQIKSVLGEKTDADIDQEVVAKLMEGDFDSDKFEELMSKMYSDEFYEKEEEEWKTDMDVKQSLLRSGEDGNDILWNEEGEGDMYDDAEEAVGDDDDNDYENHQDEQEYDATQDAIETEDDNVKYESQESKVEKQLKERMLDELYKLDYEDIIGDMPTRFKYRKVKPNRYGLTPEEILFARDSSLKQYVSLKRMAPYIEDGEYVPGAKKRRRFREMSKQEIAEEIQKYASEPSQRKTGGEGEDDQDQPKKKRRRQKKKKLTQGHNDDDQSVEKTQQSSELKKDKKNESTSETGEPPKTQKDRKKSNKDSIRKEFEGKTDKKKSTKLQEKTSQESKVKKKDRKNSEKKSKKQKVEGVSASRLASYGL